MSLAQLDVSQFSEPTPDDANHRTREGVRVALDSKAVILNDEKHGALVGKSLDESFGGVGVLLQVLPTLKVGQNIEYTRNGVVGSAIVRHITRGPKGYLLGLEWRSANLAQLARQASRQRMDHPTPTTIATTSEQERFIHTLPSSVHMIWSLCEAKNWSELTVYAARLHEQAKNIGIPRLEDPVSQLRCKFQNNDTSDELVEETVRLIKTCIAICGDGE